MNPAEKTIPMILHVWIEKQTTLYLACCLELDIAETGATHEEASNRIKMLINTKLGYGTDQEVRKRYDPRFNPHVKISPPPKPGDVHDADIPQEDLDRNFLCPAPREHWNKIRLGHWVVCEYTDGFYKEADGRFTYDYCELCPVTSVESPIPMILHTLIHYDNEHGVYVAICLELCLCTTDKKYERVSEKMKQLLTSHLDYGTKAEERKKCDTRFNPQAEFYHNTTKAQNVYPADVQQEWIDRAFFCPMERDDWNMMRLGSWVVKEYVENFYGEPDNRFVHHYCEICPVSEEKSCQEKACPSGICD